MAATKVVDGDDGGYSLSLDYGKIELVTKDQSGTPNNTNQFIYNVVTNSDSGVHPSSLALSPDGSGGPVTPAKYFLALDGLKGDSLDSNHKGWFEISGFDFDLGNTSSIGSATGGAGTGKLILSPLTLTLDSNTGLAPLLTMAATGSDAEWCDAGRRERRGPSRSTSSTWPTCRSRTWRTMPQHRRAPTLSLRYGQIELETFTQDGTGGVVPEGQFGFDRTQTWRLCRACFRAGASLRAREPATYFMLIDGINGGSQDAQHKGWFEITGVDLDLARQRSLAEAPAKRISPP